MSLIKASVGIEISRADAQRLMLDPGGPVWQAALRAGRATVTRARLELTGQNLSGRTGVLRNSIENRTSVRGEQVVSQVGTEVPYASFVHNGTDSPIQPRVARALRFRHWRGGPGPNGTGGLSGFYIYDNVRGTRDTGRYHPFLRRAVERLTTEDFLYD